MKNIVVTGGSGKAGRAVVTRLLEAGYDVLNVDVVPPAARASRFLKADLTDLGNAYEALKGAQAVVHLAAVPAPRLQPDEVTFRTNVTSTYNVFSAAVALGLERVVWASSETVLGLPFEREKPAYVPVDEEHPRYPESSYALSKVVGEEMVAQFSRWSGIPFMGLRFSNVIEPERYDDFPGFWKDPRLRKWNLWGYVDVRDVAQSCHRALEADVSGAEVFIIAAADTVMDRPSAELMAQVFPDVPIHQGLAKYDSLQSIAKAKRLLGYQPEHSWRNALKHRQPP